MGVWSLFFAWPSGQVWPNLIASAITSSLAAGLVAWRALRKLEQQHAEHRQALASDVSKQLAEHHQAVLAAVTPKAAGGPVDPSVLYRVGEGDGCYFAPPDGDADAQEGAPK